MPKGTENEELQRKIRFDIVFGRLLERISAGLFSFSLGKKTGKALQMDEVG